ncbi:MAG: hypothetical protein F4Z73_01580 [Synechococcus sp. SB0668_bin_13]|uniref:Uncharacterized protein n=1 Tax=Synechococcus sp. SB0676_bin_10 TaxID=2604869 RepID=A0A6B1F9B5_9SYNE|nr:hypothetical protein [Cyanobacteria bacterium MAG IRC3_bin_20]MDE0646476.1 hypothetical protein [Cyanobacteria bacterium MAG IRC4_bin_6]MXW11573.1 hypothetical protein [Synechococcus sp. SB0668_bin_13]MYG38958.1 hypothetical protein [Synechococcus sp. SB0676_bin_10]MYG63596.1 hypothetical protein [Synechococcus sp. SB0675_bin_7]MYK07981.1 hypothetical protein [Synechococcus sp. SB0670_bin_20]MYK86211.1 hypothetical protein [Synechococcus sp. SB0669_bin_7]
MPATVQTLLMIVTALGIWAGVGVTILIFLWNKLDKRFDAQDRRFDALHDEVKGLPLKIMEMLNKAPR